MKIKNLFAALLLMTVALGTNEMTAAVPGAKNGNVNATPLMSKLPKKGKIVKESYNEIMGCKDLELSNGAHVMLKPTDFEKDEICMSALQRGGSSLYGEEDWANCEMFNAAIPASGLGGLSNKELKKVLDGKNIEIWRSLDTYEDRISGNSTVKDLETLFQLVYLHFTDVTKDEATFNELLDAYKTRLKEEEMESDDSDHMFFMNDAFMDTTTNILYDHNWRYPFKTIKSGDMARVNYDRILEIAKERTANAAGYTFVFVGSFDDATIRPLIEQYIASLPANKGVKSNWVNVATRPQKDVVCHFTHEMKVPRTTINIRWFNTKIPYSSENYMKAKLLSDILKFKIYREKIREDTGVAFGPVGGNEQHYTEGDNTFTEVHSFVTVKPEYADEVIRILKDEMHKACEHIDEAAFNEYKQEQLEYYKSRGKDMDKTNYYWLRVINEYVLRGTDLNTDDEQIIKGLTPESISAFARELLATGHILEIVMSPAE